MTQRRIADAEAEILAEHIRRARRKEDCRRNEGMEEYDRAFGYEPVPGPPDLAPIGDDEPIW